MDGQKHWSTLWKTWLERNLPIIIYPGRQLILVNVVCYFSFCFYSHLWCFNKSWDRYWSRCHQLLQYLHAQHPGTWWAWQLPFPGCQKGRDPIAWWWDHWKVFPRLSAMPFDYLSIPGRFLFSALSYVLTSYLTTSTAVKWVFSQGQQLLHFTCNWLSPASI